MSDNRVRLTGLWLKRSKTGQEFLVGDISPSSNLVIIKNEFKAAPSEPDFIAYIASPGQRVTLELGLERGPDLSDFNQAQEGSEEEPEPAYWQDKF